MSAYSWYKLNYRVKAIIDDLIEKVKEENCFDVSPLEDIRTEISWFNTPTNVQRVVDYLEENNYKTGLDNIQWYKLFNVVEELEEIAETFNCEEIEIPEGVSTITLTEYAPDDDLNPPNESVNIVLYFEGDTPVQGTDLYVNPTLYQPFTQRGYYKYGDTTIQITSTGKVQRHNFEIPDTQAPTAPTNLSSSNTTYNSTELSWNEATDDRGVSFYQVIENGEEKVTTENTSITITELNEQTDYTYVIIAEDEAGNQSEPSNEITVTTLQSPDITPPSTPTNLTASNTTQTTVDLSWTESTDDRGISSYIVIENGQEKLTTESTEITITDLEPETTYTYSIVAVDTSDNESEPSTEITVTTLQVPDTTPPSVPTGLTSSNITQTSVDLSWNASTDDRELANYILYQDGNEISRPTSTNFSVEGLTPETTYEFTVSAIDTSENESAQSEAEQVTTLQVPDTTPPTVPTGLTASNITQTSVDLSWDASTDDRGVAEYNVYQDSSVIETVTGTSTTIDGLIADTSYNFSVSAVDTSDNESAQSTVLEVTTLQEPDTTPPTVPTGLTEVEVTDTTAEVSWTASTDDRGVEAYNVYVDGSLNQTVSGTTTIITDLITATEYNITVSAIDEAENESGQSEPLVITTL